MKFEKVIADLTTCASRLTFLVKDYGAAGPLLKEVEVKLGDFTQKEFGLRDRLAFHRYTIEGFLHEYKGKEAQACQPICPGPLGPGPIGRGAQLARSIGPWAHWAWGPFSPAHFSPGPIGPRVHLAQPIGAQSPDDPHGPLDLWTQMTPNWFVGGRGGVNGFDPWALGPWSHAPFGPGLIIGPQALCLCFILPMSHWVLPLFRPRASPLLRWSTALMRYECQAHHS